jgi:hypothetical protein
MDGKGGPTNDERKVGRQEEVVLTFREHCMTRCRTYHDIHYRQRTKKAVIQMLSKGLAERLHGDIRESDEGKGIHTWQLC